MRNKDSKIGFEEHKTRSDNPFRMVQIQNGTNVNVNVNPVIQQFGTD